LSKLSVIAIVDDDEAVREALFDLLQVEGIAARSFEGAARFLAAAEEEDFACLITDVRMPDMDGLELQRRLKARGSKVPVIFITSAADAATHMRAMGCGALAFFTKPLDNDAVLRTLRSLLGPGPADLPGC
jgi:FixJ family two-component response regulator